MRSSLLLLGAALLVTGCAAPPVEREPASFAVPLALSGVAKELTDLAAKTSPSVVRIRNETHTFKRLDRYLSGLGEAFVGLFNPHPYYEWPYRVLTLPLYLLFGPFDFGTATGSGFFVGPDLVLTNAHVIENSAALFCEFADGRVAPATIVAVDEELDAALLRTDLSGDPPRALELRRHAPRPGEPILAVGYPGRDADIGGRSRKLLPNPRLTVGIVSAINVELGNPKTAYVETDAALNPGNSGGPVVGLEGAVLGIATMVGVGKENEGYAIPASSILSTFKELLTQEFAVPKRPVADEEG